MNAARFAQDSAVSGAISIVFMRMSLKLALDFGLRGPRQVWLRMGSVGAAFALLL
jgi:hypothetical protein